jgi:undecaprenyl-diphosphatase
MIMFEIPGNFRYSGAMSIVESIVLGVIQGLTEFLPVSSSGHLVLLQKIFGIQEGSLFFDVMLHCGTLVAVFVVLRRDIWAILKKPIQPVVLYLIIATIPTVIVALLFKDAIEGAFHSGGFLGFAFFFTGCALLFSEWLAGRAAAAKKSRLEMTWLDSLVIGICQAVAIIPGVSRSGLTLSGALGRGLDRDKAARFSFLLSIPAILGALVLQIKDIATEGMSAALDGIGSAQLIAGTLAAALVGVFAVTLMLKIVREKSLRGFAIYVFVLGAFVLIDQFGTHFFF